MSVACIHTFRNLCDCEWWQCLGSAVDKRLLYIFILISDVPI